MSILQPVETFIANVEAFYEAEKPKVIAVAEEFIHEVENSLIVGLEEIGELAGMAVLDQASKAVSGEEKFGTAVTSVIQKVEAGALGVGRTILISTAQTGVQLAFSTAQKVASDAKAAGLVPPSGATHSD